MDVTTLKFDVEGFDGGIESRRAGDHIEILYQGMPVMAFETGDLTARDWTIASLLEAKLKGKTVAALCHTSTAQVSMVRKLVRRGGHEALIHRRPGRSKKLTGTRLMRAIELRRKGKTHDQIGEELGVSSATARRAVLGIPRGVAKQQGLGGVGAPPSPDASSSLVEPSPPEKLSSGEPSSVGTEPLFVPAVVAAQDSSSGEVEGSDVVVEQPEQQENQEVPAEKNTRQKEKMPKELIPAMPLPPGPAEHRCRYAGTLLICAAVQVLGLLRALAVASVRRPETSWYDAWQTVVALLSAWASGLGSLEAMHERDARALGVVLGLERSPSVRTLHRAIAQMVATFDPIAFGAQLLRGLIAAVGKVPRIFGVDGHFKPYFGKEPIDKGYDTKRRMALRGISDVLVHDEEGRIWLGVKVDAGNALHMHLPSSARQLRAELGGDEQVVLGFDRGGWCFETFEELNQAGFGYVAWVPNTVKTPELSTIAPEHDGVGEQRFVHKSLGEGHSARLLVRRDGEALVPAMTNLSEKVSAEEALEMLRRVRGMQENDIKAARAFAHIDRLADRGGARRARDDRPVDNPEYQELSKKRREVRDRLETLEHLSPVSKKERAVHNGATLMAELERALLNHQMNGVSSKVPRYELEPEAQRAWLETRNRSLIQPLKYVLANSRRWLLSALGSSLAPSDADWDATAVARTLEALIRAPGTVRFERQRVLVTLELPVPPKPHERLARGLESLDSQGLRFSDGRRSVVFRLAPRPTHDSLPSASPGL